MGQGGGPCSVVGEDPFSGQCLWLVPRAPSPPSTQAGFAGAGGNSPLEQVKKQQLASEVGGRLPGGSWAARRQGPLCPPANTVLHSGLERAWVGAVGIQRALAPGSWCSEVSGNRSSVCPALWTIGLQAQLPGTSGPRGPQGWGQGQEGGCHPI